MSNPASDRNEPRTAAGRTLLADLWPDGEPTFTEGRGYGRWIAKDAHRMWGQDVEAILAIESEATERAIGAGIDVERLARYATHRRESNGAPCQMEIGTGKRGVLPICTCGLDDLLARLTPQPGERRQEVMDEMRRDMWAGLGPATPQPGEMLAAQEAEHVPQGGAGGRQILYI